MDNYMFKKLTYYVKSCKNSDFYSDHINYFTHNYSLENIWLIFKFNVLRRALSDLNIFVYKNPIIFTIIKKLLSKM